ncbi:translational GTPase TypA [Candidatus Nanoperiomorbus periodonticus]|jgi:GTP-binding protein TypA|uniref:translational GTPase TypA n=1 Tax=Candidatus Nanoperiomorbus periodonticus TaxID=2171989 RepID=UPI00101D52DF|nr:translational GTPase TypA [Candidatus Nanoperiomorbus periodonticus]RYC76257.1 GTP-binding protein TypA/BipA [Candidatus Nanoperiomorbus periodonticus]
MYTPDKIRNIAIIAHVDHGKTTLLDGLLKQSHTFRDNAQEMSETLIMDSGDQERERGITITAKTTAITYDGYKINIIDTPGHADFSGEVERTLQMADGVLLVVDAAEGPMPQTRFVLAKALELGLKPIVIINKIDKPARRIEEVKDEVADLFLELATSDDQLDYPVYYAIGRDGKAWTDTPDSTTTSADLTPIFRAIIEHIPAPQVDPAKPFRMLITSLQYDSFLGKYALGRIERGVAKAGAPISLISPDGTVAGGKIDKLFTYNGLNRQEVDRVVAGDIVAITGVSQAKIGETITDPADPTPLPSIEIEQPTISIYLGPNTSPFKGREGKFNTSRQIAERLERELETNVALRVEPANIGFRVSGRGELHLSVLIETLRREGYEFEVGRPQVILIERDGQKMESVEELFIEVSPELLGSVSMELGARHGELTNQETTSQGQIRATYRITSRALIGLHNTLLTATKGTIIMSSLPCGYQPLGAPLSGLRNGVLIAAESGTSTAYALAGAEARGELYIGPSTEVYAGEIVGLNKRKDDLEINVCKGKQLTNMRSKSSDGAIQLTPYTQMSLEQCLDFIEDDELLEVTPQHLRLRKAELDPIKRKRAHRH